MNIYLAIDLGAESGRVVAVGLDGERVFFEELHRFPHAPVWLPSGLHWNITQLWQEILVGLQRAALWAHSAGHSVVSVGVDGWGVDWALVNRHGELLGIPHAYRDPRNHAAFEQAVGILGVDKIYQTTGIQLMAINSLYSLYATSQRDPGLVEQADRMLFLPDLIHYWLSGVMAVEQTIASTSQMVDPRTGQWARTLLEPLGLPTHLLGEIVPPGTQLGPLRSEVAEATGLSPQTVVVAPGAHDTASAVAAVPADNGVSWCFLSSGTWSLLGCELEQCLTNAAAQRAMFTNEAGVAGKVRFLKNIAGLWLVQECRRAWQQQGVEYSYVQLVAMAQETPPFRTLVNPAWGAFQVPGQMLEKIGEFARLTHQPGPRTPGEFVRCALESLAYAYRRTLEALEGATGRTFSRIHIVGGGSRNELLNQLTADVTGREVVAGPVEATALGNGLTQALARGDLRDLDDLRRAVREGSRDLLTYQPREQNLPEELGERVWAFVESVGR